MPTPSGPQFPPDPREVPVRAPQLVAPDQSAVLSRSGVDLSARVTSTYSLAEVDRPIDAVLEGKSQVKVHITSSAIL